MRGTSSAFAFKGVVRRFVPVQKWRFFLQRRLRPLFPLLHDISQELAIDILILEESCMKKRILSLLLAAVMLLSLLPAGVLAAEDGKVSVTLSGLHSAQVNSLKLYTYTNGQKGTDNLLP